VVIVDKMTMTYAQTPTEQTTSSSIFSLNFVQRFKLMKLRINLSDAVDLLFSTSNTRYQLDRQTICPTNNKSSDKYY